MINCFQHRFNFAAKFNMRRCTKAKSALHAAAAAAAQAERRPSPEVGRCRLTLSNPSLNCQELSD